MGDYQEIPKLLMRHRSWQNIPEENSGKISQKKTTSILLPRKLQGCVITSITRNQAGFKRVCIHNLHLHYGILSMYSIEFEILGLAATEKLAKNPGTLTLYIIRMPRLGETSLGHPGDSVT